MNKIEGIRGFLTFCLILISLIFLFLAVKFVTGRKMLKEPSNASRENIPSAKDAPSPPTENNANAATSPSTQGFKDALSSYNPLYDLNKDNVINMYDYYLLVSPPNQTSHNN